MARKDALLRLHERLVAKRDALRRKLAEDFDLNSMPSRHGGDIGDAANDGASEELNSQLASLESRELFQVERALVQMREGRYGTCEGCDVSIPITRLKALPYTALCVDCQREQEASGRGAFDFDVDWEGAYEMEGRMQDRELTIGDLDLSE